jgi:prepilin-type N-terminal cleavage/methylation domain-containing protein
MKKKTFSLSRRSMLQGGFTLIELSIVLVIIGLIIGGVLVGRDLVAAATVRAQISQIEKYNAAVNTFRGKYGYLPGDMPDPAASNYGFAARGTLAGQGDGNGTIQGNNCASAVDGTMQAGGETVMFWKDLSTANLIDNGFSLFSYTPWACSASLTNSYYPLAKLGNYFIFVMGFDGLNYFHLGATYTGYGGGPGPLAGGLTAMTVIQAFAIDSKIDDGLPQTGRVIAKYEASSGFFTWAHAGAAWSGTAPGGNANPGPALCYDNAPTLSGSPMHYSVGYNNGIGGGCALLVEFQ